MTKRHQVEKEDAVKAKASDEAVEMDQDGASSVDEGQLDQQLLDLHKRISDLQKELGDNDPSAESEAGKNEETGEAKEPDWELNEWKPPPHCIPIRADVRSVDFNFLNRAVPNFDVIMMDPPWQLAGANPTRGVALGYQQLSNDDIGTLPIPLLQTDGFLFIWVINARYAWTLAQMEKWGYTYVDDITWVKVTVNRRPAKSHGFYLQHAKETCLVGKKGKDPIGMQGGVGSDVIFAERRGQSQKPEEIYSLIEKLVPNGKYLEIFARRNNLRNFWVSIGNEL